MDHIPSFEITTYDFAAKHYSDWIFPYDYHYLYILENGKDAYIGETNDIKVRTGDHRKKADFCHQFHFRRIHVITGIDITATPAKHYENMLIKLMEIDQKFHVRNTEPGVRTFYHSKNEFELGFDQLWQKLAEKGLVSHMEFKTILNSSEYKYSPFTRLTPLQQEALESTINALHCSDSQKQRDAKHTRPILIKRDAGTGKTVVAASLFYHLKQDPAFSDKKVCLVYANPATREELKSVFRCIPGKYQDDIIAPIHVTKKHYDIVICDEAQHLRRDKNLGAYGALLRKNNERLALPKDNNELDWLLAYSDYQVLLYDKKQLSTPMDLPAADFNRLLDVEHGGIRQWHCTSKCASGQAAAMCRISMTFCTSAPKLPFPLKTMILAYSLLFRICSVCSTKRMKSTACAVFAAATPGNGPLKTIPLIPTSSSMEQRSGGTARPANGSAIPKPSWKWAAFIPSSVWT